VLRDCNNSSQPKVNYKIMTFHRITCVHDHINVCRLRNVPAQVRGSTLQMAGDMGAGHTVPVSCPAPHKNKRRPHMLFGILHNSPAQIFGYWSYIPRKVQCCWTYSSSSVRFISTVMPNCIESHWEISGTKHADGPKN
jgi:hypothetical protein